MDCAGDANTAQEQSDKAAQVEKAVEIAQRASEAALAVGDGIHAQAVAAGLGTDRVLEGVGVASVVKAEEGGVGDPAALLNEAGAVDIVHRYINARLNVGE